MANINNELNNTEEKLKNIEKQVESLKNKVNNAMNSIKHAIANVINVIRTLNNIINKTALFIVGAFQKAISTVQRIIQLFGNLGDRIRLTHRDTNILKGSFTELKSVIDLLTGAFNKLMNNQFINEGKQLLSSIQTLNMLIGTELTESTIEWANNLENAFGISAAGLISDLKELTAVMYGLGMSSSNVQIAATNLEAVAMSLSATTGYDFSTVVNKIQSGMKGMTQSIDDLGLSVRESQMDAFLKKLKAQGGEYANIGTSFSSLTEQQRIYVRYAAIMDQFTSKSAYSAENYAKSLNTITGRLSVLNSQVRALKSAIGTLALQLLNKIIMPLTYIVYLARQAVKSVAELLNIDINLNAGMNGGDTSEIDDTTDALNEMNDAAKEAKGSLDNLDHVSTTSNSNNSGKDDFDYSKLMDISGDYASTLEKLGNMNDDYIEKCKQKLIEMLAWMKQKITDWVKEWTGRIIDWDVIKSNLKGAWTNIKNMFKNIQSIARTTFGIVSGLLYSVFDDLDITRLLLKFTEVLERITNLVDTILKRIAPKIQEFYDKYLSKYVVKFGDFLEEKLNELIYKLNDLIGWWEDPGNESAIDDWFNNLGKNFEALVKTISEVLTIIKTVFTGGSLDDTIKMEDSSDNMWNMYQAAVSLHQILYDVLDIIEELAIHIVDFNGDGSFTFDDISIAIETIKEKLDDIRKWIDENKESITNILSAVWDTIVKIGEAKFTIIKDLIQFIVDNEDTVVKLLETIQKVLDFVIAHPIISAEIAVGVQLAGTAIKTAATAMLWKSILGIGAGGGAISAAKNGGSQIGKVIAYHLSTKVSGAIKTGITAAQSINWAGVQWITALVVALTQALKTGIDDIFGKDGIKFENTFDFETLDNGKLQEQANRYYHVLKEHYGENIPRSMINTCLDYARKDLESTGKYTQEQIDRMVAIIESDLERNITEPFRNIAGTGTIFASQIVEDVNTSVDSITKLEDETTELKNTTANNATSTANSVVSMTNRIVSACNSSIAGVRNLINTINSLNKMSVHTVTTQTSGWASNKGKVSIGTIRGFANGGSPKSGSIFMANENGNTELVGNFGGYSGVANQDMIITAIQNAMTNAMKNAGANNSSISNYNFEICKSGMFVGDDSTVRKLANMINSTNISNRNNIANVGFSM